MKTKVYYVWEKDYPPREVDLDAEIKNGVRRELSRRRPFVVGDCIRMEGLNNGFMEITDINLSTDVITLQKWDRSSEDKYFEKLSRLRDYTCHALPEEIPIRS